MSATGVVWTIIGGGNTQTVLGGKKISFMHSQSGGGCKNFAILPSSLVLVLVPHMSHLVKLSVPNILQ